MATQTFGLKPSDLISPIRSRHRSWELALERLFIRGGGDLFVRRQAVTSQAVGSPRGKVQGPATPAAVRQRRRRSFRSGIGRLLRGDLFLTKIAAKGLSAVRAGPEKCDESSLVAFSTVTRSLSVKGLSQAGRPAQPEHSLTLTG